MRLDMPLNDNDFLANKENEEGVQLADKRENAQFTDTLIGDTDLFEFFDDSPSQPVTSHQATTSSELSVRERFPLYIFLNLIYDMKLRNYIIVYMFVYLFQGLKIINRAITTN